MVLLIVTLAIAALLDFSGLLVPYSLKTLDLMFRRLPLAPASPDVAIIAIDQADLDFFKEQGVGWPWPRELYGPIIDFCRRGGAKAVIFDMLYTEPSVYGRDDDQRFARSAKEAANVIVPFFLSRRSKTADAAATEILQKYALPTIGSGPIVAKDYLSILAPIPPLLDAARGLGNVECSPDSDGIFRRLPLVVPFEGRWLPMLGFAAFQLSRPAKPWNFDNGSFGTGRSADSSGPAGLSPLEIPRPQPESPPV